MDLPLFPLHTVLFPGGRLPLRIFEQRYLEMAKACLRDGTPFGVCLIRDGAEVGAAATPMDVGTLAKIASWDMPSLGMLEIVALGGERFRILERRIERDGLARAKVEMLAPEADPLALGGFAWCTQLTQLAPIPLALLQELLELDDSAARVALLKSRMKGFRGLS